MDVTVLHHSLNLNSSNHSSGASTGENLEFKAIKMFFYFVILLSSTLGNIMVAYIITTTRKMRTPSNYLILNLAICDILTPILSIPFDFFLEENKYVWCYGGFMCKILWPASTMTCTASALTLAVIALDRYRLIMHPFKPRLTARVIRCAIAGTYVFSLILVSPYVAVLRYKDDTCSEAWPDSKYRQGYTLILFLMQYGLPLPFMITMYVLALRSLYQSTRRASLMQNTYINQQSDAGDFNQQNNMTNAKEQKYNANQLNEREANKRATIMFIIVLVVFTIVMLPNQIVWLWADFGHGTKLPGFEKAMIICWLFTYSNCVLNPVIFTAFSRDFRNGFKRIFRSRCRWFIRKSQDDPSRRISHSLVTNGVTSFSMYISVDTVVPSSETVL